MNNISMIIVGIDGWNEFTEPLQRSIKQFEPDAEIVIINNHSKTPYPGSNVIHTPRTSYAEAINTALRGCHKDWFMWMNNDVLCQGKFMHLVDGLDHNAIYGRQIIEEKGHRWIGNWIGLMSRQCWHKVGDFDPKFEMCGFEDADYCYRAEKLGMKTLPIDLPFYHYWGMTRWQLPNYPEVREKNMDYFEQKHGFRLGDDVRVLSE